MGAKQSKRSVDISGKEAESAGEVAAAGAGGEGRVEAIADADALKPQVNGDAHIQPPQEITDKEKQLDSGTPENEKDATTEKEGKEELNDEKEVAPVTNGDNESPKEENSESVSTPEDGKKPKKEKVKKKWSLRSISFSRKDKPKQEKKSKEEEPKTNGDPEKVPEEAAEATPENVENKTVEVKADSEVKEQKTPETPVTEPLTNGNSTPESPKEVEAIATDEPVLVPEQPQEVPAAEIKPEQLPVNGLSLEEPKKETLEVAPIESKPEETTAVATETAPAPEIPVKTEVCDAKMPLIEPTPPPLPANPPPSSVASFAATTMAPELIEASLANTTENAILTPPAIPVDKPDENETETQQTVTNNTNLAISDFSPPLKETLPGDMLVATPLTEMEIENVPEIDKNDPQVETVKIESKVEKDTVECKEGIHIKENVKDLIKTDVEVIKEQTEVEVDITPTEVVHIKKTEVEIPLTEKDVQNEIIDTTNAPDVSDATPEVNVVVTVNLDIIEPVEAVQSQVVDNIQEIEKKEGTAELCTTPNNQTLEPTSDVPDTIGELPAHLPLLGNDNIIRRDDKETEPRQTGIIDAITKEIALNANTINDDLETNGIIDEIEQSKFTAMKKDALGNIIDTIECNGNAVLEESVPMNVSEEVYNGRAVTTPDDSLPPSPSEATEGATSAASDSLPPPPSDLSHGPDDADSLRLQEPLPIADKIADLIPEIPTVPDLKTETETCTEVTVAD